MRTIHKIDLLVLSLSAFLLVGAVGYAQPLVISPLDGTETTNSSVLFSFDKAGEILIDDNIEFTSPERIFAEDNLIVKLEAGKYYWKVKGAMESKVHELEIKSNIDLRLRSSGDEYELVNAGNVNLNVVVFNCSYLQEEMILKIDESANTSGTLFVGGQE